MDARSATDSDRRRLTASIKQSLRALAIQLSLLNHQVGARAGLNDVDLDCLDLIARQGPLSPSALAQRAALHPATVTGILDRLEEGGWVVRERDASDRRAVVVRVLREKSAELSRLYAGMNSSMSEICAGYDDAGERTLAGVCAERTGHGKAVAVHAPAFVAREDGGADQRDDEILKFVDRDVCRRESGRKMEPVGDESERRIERQRQHPIREREEHRRPPQHPELSIRADKEPLEAWRDHGGPAWIGGVL